MKTNSDYVSRSTARKLNWIYLLLVLPFVAASKFCYQVIRLIVVALAAAAQIVKPVVQGFVARRATR